MKPFSTPVLSKRTYRELKLLKHIQHENVPPPHLLYPPQSTLTLCLTCVIDHQPQRCFHFPTRRFVRAFSRILFTRFRNSRLMISFGHRYFVTELLGTDLHRLLTSRPLEKQFIQYFLYQILVRYPCYTPSSLIQDLSFQAWTQVCSFGRRRPSRSRAFFSFSTPHPLTLPYPETQQHPRE